MLGADIALTVINDPLPKSNSAPGQTPNTGGVQDLMMASMRLSEQTPRRKKRETFKKSTEMEYTQRKASRLLMLAVNAGHQHQSVLPRSNCPALCSASISSQ